MIPSSFPLDLYHGDSYTWQFKLWLDANKTQPLDLTGVVAKAEIRETPGSTKIYVIGCELVPPNIIVATLTATICKSLPITSHMWDLQLTYPDGQVNTILAGPVSVTADITDSDAVIPTGAGTAVQPPEGEPQAMMAMSAPVDASSAEIVRAPRITALRR